MSRVKIYGARGGRVWPLVLQAAAESREAGRLLILYVPEQYTLQAERDLIRGLKLPGLLNLRVVSPRKLRLQVEELAGTDGKQPLNEFGRLMAVHRIMTEKAGELAFYGDMTDLPGAVNRVSSALEELRESEITPEELAEYAEGAATGAERAKLRDLQAIWKGYEELIGDQFSDEKAAWTEMISRLEQSGMWDGADLAVYGFDTIRPDLRELVTRMQGRLHSVKVFLIMDHKNAPDGRIFAQQRESAEKLEAALETAGIAAEEILPRNVREDCAEPLRHMDRNLFALNPESRPGPAGDALTLYAGGTPWDEAEKVSETLRIWHEQGIPWNEMAIALPSGAASGNLLKANLEINGIPCVWQQKKKAAEHPMCRMLTAALACLSGGYRTEQVISFARSGFCSLTEEEGILLAEYARARGIEGSRWQKPFTTGSRAAEAEALRKKLLDPLEDLRERLKKARTAAESVIAVMAFLDAEQVWERLQEDEVQLIEHEMYREAVINRQVWKMLMDLLEQLYSLLGTRRAAIRDLGRMLESALESATVTELPGQENGVVIGEVGHLLAGETEALILPMTQDGLMAAPESGWLSDPERRRLEEKTGRTVGISREAGCLIRQYDIYRTLTLPRQKLMISWSLQAEGGGALQPDGLIARLKGLFPDLREEGGIQAADRSPEPVTPRAVLYGLSFWTDEMRAGDVRDVPKDWKDALVRLIHSGGYGTLTRDILAEVMPEEEKRLAKDTSRRLFLTEQLSVSRLEQFASCPYRHFIEYGLKPVQQETFTFESDDAGSFFHSALDRYMKRAGADPEWPAFTPERVDREMDAVLQELTAEWQEGPLGEDALGEWTGEGYLRRVRRAARVLTRFAGNSDFRTIATEKSFGTPDGLPPVVMILRDGSRVSIRGTIDRIDTYENGEGVWLRIVDNKSRDKKPDPARMATGEQLQLMIYLKAAADSMPNARMAGALYFPVTDKEVDTAADEPQAIEDDRLETSRMKGLVTAEPDVIRAMDRDRQPFSVDKVFKKDGTVLKSASWAVEEETLRGLTEAAAEKAGELCSRMRDGEIEASPGEDDAGSVCRYCEYRAICRTGGKKGRERDVNVTYQQIAGKNTLRE